MNPLTIQANAKLNLCLDIVGKRDDGYHNIVSVMQEIDLADIVYVRITDARDIQVSCDNPAIPVNGRNVAYRAAERFLRECRIRRGVQIHIQKRIPVMSGLGGSSTDGAAVLKALNSLCGEILCDDELIKMGAELGADVPFCIVGGRARCSGIGEIIKPLPDSPSQFYVIVRPDFCCCTKSAFGLYNDGFKRGSKANIFEELYNDERINRIRDELIAAGAKTASLTGSGSAVFGVFDDYKSAASAKAAFDLSDYPFKYIAKNVIKTAQGG
ncbi:MAG: 4-(cytidine 5'-diphospho)-2-C-methyl-D-erythritol kinase [Oscillospiraceae bacterium]|nr:4-(cytidine 5'-diphospho)-2-C-methyl-D-erythritol kinase [Oscillospiraceae bacterium]